MIESLALFVFVNYTTADPAVNVRTTIIAKEAQLPGLLSARCQSISRPLRQLEVRHAEYGRALTSDDHVLLKPSSGARPERTYLQTRSYYGPGERVHSVAHLAIDPLHLSRTTPASSSNQPNFLQTLSYIDAPFQPAATSFNIPTHQPHRYPLFDGTSSTLAAFHGGSILASRTPLSAGSFSSALLKNSSSISSRKVFSQSSSCSTSASTGGEPSLHHNL